MPKSILFSVLLVLGIAISVVPVSGQSGNEARTLQPEADVEEGPVKTEHDILREQYIKLATERAKAMRSDELAQAIEVLQRQQDEAAAEAEVHKAYRILQAVTAKYPETRSAKIAKSGIDSIERARDLPVGTNVTPFSQPPFTR